MDSEVRAIHAAKIAPVAFFWFYCVWWMVSLGIERGRKREYLAWTELNAKTAGFTSFDNY
jgi:hypothetical protein